MHRSTRSRNAERNSPKQRRPFGKSTPTVSRLPTRRVVPLTAQSRSCVDLTATSENMSQLKDRIGHLEGEVRTRDEQILVKGPMQQVNLAF